MLTPHVQLVETVLHTDFIKDIWNFLWTTRNQRWSTWATLRITNIRHAEVI